MAQYKCVFYDFGPVQTGFSAEKTIIVYNDQTEIQEYEVNRDPSTNPLDYVFEVEPSSIKINPGCEFQFKLRYSPLVPDTVNFDYFNISDVRGIFLKFGAKGYSLGCSVNISVKQLVFLCTDSKKNCYKKIFLKNKGKVCATFHFDIDETQSVFKLDRCFGKVSPNKNFGIGITFEPPCPGCYFKKLHCLIEYQSPLVIEAVGLCKTSDVIDIEDLNFKHYPQLESIGDGYGSYVYDVVGVANHKPPLTLSNSYLDFGQTNFDDKQNISSSISITNHMKEIALFEWDLDKTGVFTVYPHSAKISSEHSALFQVYFRPCKQNVLYSIELEGRAYWEYACEDDLDKNNPYHKIKIPIPFSVRMMGHTLPPGTEEWEPNFQIVPHKIVLPACLPPFPVYTTFMIYNLDQHPLMFKFLPPKLTNYILKPMQGIIKCGYQIIIVGMFPGLAADAAYMERWGLQLNGSSKYEVFVDFYAYAEYPSLQIGNMNMVVFPATFPGCEQTINVPIRNITRHCLSFHYDEMKIPNSVKMVGKDGIIASNEIIYHLWQFTPTSHGEHLVTLKCESNIINEHHKPCGDSVTIVVTGYGYSEYVDLVAFPKKIDFGISSWGETKTKSFHLFNFGNCRIHFKLKILHTVFAGESNCQNDISLSPVNDTVGALEKKEITVTICPSETGIHEFTIMYDVRINSKSENIIENSNDVVLATVLYVGVFPSLFIHDLKIINGGPIFSKLHLWKLLNINRLNNALARVTPNSMIEVTMSTPAAPVGTSPCIIILLLNNSSSLLSKWEVKRYKNCDCQLVNLTKGMSFRYKEYNCPHRPMLELLPTLGELEPEGKGTLRMVVQYKMEGCWNLKYMINLPNNRSVMLSVFINVLSIERPLPTTMVFWIYNNSAKELSYEVDTSHISTLHNLDLTIQIFNFLNPKGEIPPKSSCPILIVFNPMELRVYEMSCALNMEDIWTSLDIVGNGSVSYVSRTDVMREKMPETRQFVVQEEPILVSTDHIVIKSVSTFSKAEYVFFIENNTDHVFVYQWQRHEIPNVLKATVHPNSNSLHPHQAHMCKLTVETFGQPCLLTFSVHCHFLDVTQRRLHEKTILIYEAIEKCLGGQFVITEKGTTLPVNDVLIEPPPKPLFLVMSVTCSIQSWNSLESTLPFKKQLRLAPSGATFLGNYAEFKLDLHELNVAISVLEKMLWELVFSKWFDNLTEQLHKEDTPYYCQIVMDKQERESENEFSYLKPSQKMIESILNDVIYELLHDEFELGPVCKENHKTDIRKTKRFSTAFASDDHMLSDENIKQMLSEGKIKVPSGK